MPGGMGLRLKYGQPMHVDDVAADFPNLTIIAAHPGWPWSDEVGFLIFPNEGASRDPHVRERLREGMALLRDDGGGSSTYPTRAIVLEEPPSIDSGEITDKGYINQRAVLERRTAIVERLYAEPPEHDVILL